MVVVVGGVWGEGGGLLTTYIIISNSQIFFGNFTNCQTHFCQPSFYPPFVLPNFFCANLQFTKHLEAIIHSLPTLHCLDFLENLQISFILQTLQFVATQRMVLSLSYLRLALALASRHVRYNRLRLGATGPG